MSGAGMPKKIPCMPDSSRKRANLVDRHAEGGNGEKAIKTVFWGIRWREEILIFIPNLVILMLKL